MIERARQTVAEAGLQDRDIDLRVAGMTETHLPSGFADVAISNCVINLCPDREAVYEEALRIVRPGRRLAISDIVLAEDIDPELREHLQSTWAGCLGGAIPEEAYWRTVAEAGFATVRIISRHTLTSEELEALLAAHQASSRGPLYESVVQMPVMVDKTLAEKFVEGDEYVYTPN